MKLVNGDRAIIPLEKLLSYCLNPEHHSGKHKARVFASALGITAKNPEDLRQLIARAACEGEVRVCKRICVSPQLALRLYPLPRLIYKPLNA
jgi:hypothetical protein